MSDPSTLPPDLRPVKRAVPVALEPLGEPSKLERWGGGCISTLGAWILTAVVFVGVLEWNGAGAMWFALLVAVGVIWLARKFENTERRGRRRIRKWRRAARKAGWVDVMGDRHQRRLRSPAGVELTLTADPQAQVVVTLRPTLAEGQANPEVWLSRDLGERPPSGDPWLDDRVSVEGDPAVWRSLWDAHDRKRLGQLADSLGLKVQGNHLEVALVHVAKLSRRRRREHLAEWAALAQTLAYTPAELPEALFRRVAAEPGPVGLLAFHSLRSGWPDAPQLAQAEQNLRIAGSGGGPWAVSLGALLEDAELIEAGLALATPADQRWGVDRLTRLWPAAEVEARLVALLDHWHPTLRGAALRVMGDQGVALPVARLVALTELPEEALGDLLTYLHQAALPEAEPVWIALLKTEHAEALRAAVDALADLGTRAAVAPLMAVDAGWRFQRHVDRALEAVRGRLPATAGAGHLAVVAGDAGGLAVAPAEGDTDPE